jgi:hypothetical protein
MIKKQRSLCHPWKTDKESNCNKKRNNLTFPFTPHIRYQSNEYVSCFFSYVMPLCRCIILTSSSRVWRIRTENLLMSLEEAAKAKKNHDIN